MDQLIFDTGVKEYQINGVGVLRFNPSDPNVYNRFMAATDKIREVEKSMAAKATKIDKNKDPDARAKAALQLMSESDFEIKNILSEAFGGANDFHAILEGVNLLAVGSNGYRVISNLMDVLTPIMEAGAKSFADGQIKAAKQNREQRRAQQ